MYHHLSTQSLILNASQELKIQIFENSIKLKYNTKLTLETMNKLNKLTLEIMQLTTDASNFIGVEYYFLWPAQGPQQSQHL